MRNLDEAYQILCSMESCSLRYLLSPFIYKGFVLHPRLFSMPQHTTSMVNLDENYYYFHYYYYYYFAHICTQQLLRDFTT